MKPKYIQIWKKDTWIDSDSSAKDWTKIAQERYMALHGVNTWWKRLLFKFKLFIRKTK